MVVASQMEVTLGQNLSFPDKYHSYLDVCEKKNADLLPPCRNYDCPTDLQPRTKVPYERIYSVSEPELEALRGYMQILLLHGILWSC